MGHPLPARRLLKKAIAQWVPESILDRKKVGMPSPFPRLIARERIGLVGALLLARDSCVRSRSSANWFESLIATEAHAVRSSRVLYSLVIPEVGHRRFIREKDDSHPTQRIHDLAALPNKYRPLL